MMVRLPVLSIGRGRPESGSCDPRLPAFRSPGLRCWREELVLALVDDDAAKRYEKRFGLNPRDALDLDEVVLPG
jgi:hypothetical protein